MLLGTTIRNISILMMAFMTVSSAQDSPVRVAKELLAKAEKARAQGMVTVDLPAFWSYTPTGVNTLEKVIQDHSIVKATPVAIATTAETSDNLMTWYKMTLIETLSAQPVTNATPLPNNVPSSLLPLRANEFILRHHGGRLTIAGIRFVQPTLHVQAPLDISKTYLLFLYFECSGALGDFVADAGSAYLIDAADGATLTPLAGQTAQHRLIETIHREFGDNLPRLRTQIEILKRP